MPHEPGLSPNPKDLSKCCLCGSTLEKKVILPVPDRFQYKYTCGANITNARGDYRVWVYCRDYKGQRVN